MKIKTICFKLVSEGMTTFDETVNAAMAEGWRLVKREVLPGVNLGDRYFAPHLYAELVELDPVPEVPEVPEPQPMDLLDAVRAIKDTCLGVSVADCNDDRCPLAAWCNCLPESSDPSDWVIPKKEDAQA